MNEKSSTPIEERVKRGPSAALGDTRNGGADVPSDEQGVSNRAGDMESVGGAPGDGDAIEIIDETDDDAEDDDETDDDAEDDDEAEDELDEDGEEEDDVDDPAAEPGKPISEQPPTTPGDGVSARSWPHQFRRIFHACIPVRQEHR